MDEARSHPTLSQPAVSGRDQRGRRHGDRAGLETQGRRRDRGGQGRASNARRDPGRRRLCRRRLGVAELTYRDAVARGIAQEMSRDPDVVFLGEDVAKAGGVFKATVGLLEQFGPQVVRTGNGAGSRFGAQHSQSVENWAMMIPGLKVVAPSTPKDVIGLMAAAVR